jgi:hypothetical protein
VEAPKNIWNPKTGILTKLACLKTNGTLYANLVTWNKRLSSGLFGFFVELAPTRVSLLLSSFVLYFWIFRACLDVD